MTTRKNMLLWRGELLTQEQNVASGGSKKEPPYSYRSARSFVASRMQDVGTRMRSLPSAACPNDEAVAIVTMHPRYLSKSDFPDQLLRRANLTALGSKPKMVKPRRWGTKKDDSQSDDKAPSTDLFVCGKRSSFQNLPSTIVSWREDSTTKQLQTIEDINVFSGSEKLRGIPAEPLPEKIARQWFEVVLHNAGRGTSILRSFTSYAKKFGARLNLDKVRTVGGLTFVPVHAPPSILSALADFSFVRVARGMPTLRPFRPTIVRGGLTLRFPVELPESLPRYPTSVVAVFDGGLPDDHHLSQWIDSSDVAPIGQPVPHFQAHGLAVTSALLFGPISDTEELRVPFTKAHHYRVLDGTPAGGLQYLDVLERIVGTLERTAGQYKFVNISLGPSLAVEDDEVTAWTAAIDEVLHRHSIVATVAAGNDGELDSASGLNRVQPPADGVNVIAIGATDSLGGDWQRAPYSCVGPGRSPGVVKPDGVCFGGSQVEPFLRAFTTAWSASRRGHQWNEFRGAACM